MYVEEAVYVSMRINSEIIGLVRSHFPLDQPTYLSAELEGASKFLIDALDEPKKRIGNEQSMNWDWIVEPQAEGAELPLVVRIKVISGDSSELVVEKVLLKYLDKVEAVKTTWKFFVDWLSSLAGIATSLGVVLGGLWTAARVFHRPSPPEGTT
ncbi:MAG: hypothetical protein AAF541_22805 [Pseudomonadota bacterium]